MLTSALEGARRLHLPLAAGLVVMAGCGPMPPEGSGEVLTDSDAIRGGIRPCHSAGERDCCGNGICEGRETCSSCSDDCAPCAPADPMGALGQACRADGSCDAGLLCDASDVCVESVLPDPCVGIACSGHGTCVVSAGAATCDCESGYVAEGLSCAAAAEPGSVDCAAIAERWELCAATATTCAAVFRDSAGCQAVCAAAGLDCLAVYEDAAGSCAANPALPALSCASPSGHGSDYCVCGTAAACVPNCAGRSCGDDGCGGSCGTCSTGLTCAVGQCQAPPAGACGDGRCDGSDTCSSCPADCGVCCADGTPPIVPGALGFGTCTAAGRGGQILRVTNLNDSGPGSLRAAVSASGARIVVFEISGRIDLQSVLSVSNPFIVLAGQTAPSPGIQVTGRTFAIKTHDVLVQHLRFRVGDEGKTRDGSWDSSDAVQIYGTGAYNIVLDHITANWSIDDVIDITGGVRDVSVIDSILAEPLNNSVHSKGAHGYVSLVAYDAQRVFYARNLFGSGTSRLPLFKYCGLGIVNNLMYNTSSDQFSVAYPLPTSEPEYASIPTRASIVNNTYKDGPAGTATWGVVLSGTPAAGSACYVAGNSYDGGALLRAGPSYLVSSSPANTWPTGLTALPESQVEAYVLAHAGARPAERDAVEARLIQQVSSRTGAIINSQTEVGGFPVYATNRRTFDAGVEPNGDDDHDGYTNAEELLHALAAALE